MKYEDIKTEKELFTFMEKNINYGFCYEGNIYKPEDKDYASNTLNYYHLASPEELLKNKYGVCFDQVELERDWFKKHNIKFKTYFMMFYLPYNNDYSTHTFLIYEKNNKYYYFEHAFYDYKGIHEFETMDEAIKYIKDSFISYNDKIKHINEDIIKSLKICEYDNVPYNISFLDFIDYIINNGKNI